MNNQFLQMSYHPAKKVVEFKRFVSDKEVPIQSDSKLYKYMNMKDNVNFVLQDYGNAFFNDITCAFDGETSIKMEVTTTKNDFEDLLQMIEYYNKDSNVKITATLLTELPDMKDTYTLVKKHGEKAITLLEKNEKKFKEIDMSNNDVEKSVNTFSEEVKKSVDSVRSKIDSLIDNNINLCFTGVYSAGKSALINAILGYRILYEDIKSSTARMFIIKSPKHGEVVRIFFNIRENHTEILWNEESKIFEFITQANEDNTRKSIQSIINKNKSERQHSQLYEILKALNGNDDINGPIQICFPIPLDNERVRFTIYDTPGTDSNTAEHENVLKSALSEQTHSILVFIAAPDKIEGAGNSTLLSCLKNAENKDNKVSIDIDRSLFVINKADSVENDKQKSLQTAKITAKTEDGFSIKLEDKKLFFVSAHYAYSAKAVANKIAEKEDNDRIEDDYNKICKPGRGRYYRNNRIATSEYATGKLIERCDKALEKAEKKNDNTGVFHICSGLFALESEIIIYGEKYASAVRAFAIIDSVQKALTTMQNKAKMLSGENEKNKEQVEKTIFTLEAGIKSSIKKAYQKYEIPPKMALPNNIIKKLQLDSKYLEENITKKSLNFIEELLQKWLFGILGGVRYNGSHKQEIMRNIKSVLDDYTRTFLKNSQVLLEETRDNFIAEVKQAIFENGDISKEAKSFILEINKPDIKTVTNVETFGGLYDSKMQIDTFLFIENKNIDKEALKNGVEDKLTDIVEEMTKNFTESFRRIMASVLTAIEKEFTQNLDIYSVQMKAKLGDKEAMRQLGEKISATAEELMISQKELDDAIWSVKHD